MKKSHKASVIIVILTALIMGFLIFFFRSGTTPEISSSPSPTATVQPTAEPTPTKVPVQEGFADVLDYVPDAIIDMRYYGSENFVGRPITGYESNRAILTTEACKALQKAADELRQQGYRIYIFDAYRPADAVADFVSWGHDESDTKMKAEYYPDLDKEDLFKMYISSDSNHSRGSTIDLTITDADGNEIDMGGHFDFFGEISHTFSTQITADQLANRKILRTAMEDAGFIASNTEWWHFLLKNQPYTEAFNFYVR